MPDTDFSNTETSNQQRLQQSSDNFWKDHLKVGMWTKNLCCIAIVMTICLKLYNSQVNLTVDFPTLLSLLLAFFSIFISAQFYFKATDTSNVFYDNTYKFTQNISDLLVKIESGFGEKLKHIDDNYTMLRKDYLSKTETKEMKDKEITIEADINKKLSEKELFIENIITKLNTTEEEKNSILEQYKMKEKDLERLHEEMIQLRRDNEVLSRNKFMSADRDLLRDRIDSFTRTTIFQDSEISKDDSMQTAWTKFNRHIPLMDRIYVRDLEEQGLIIEGKLTRRGRLWLRDILFHEL